MGDSVLTVSNLKTKFETRQGQVEAVSDVSFSIAPGETVALVGESGSGKSVTSLSVMHLLESTGSIGDGTILFDGKDITHLSEDELRKIRGAEISMIFQDPSTCLDPVYTVENQLREVLEIHGVDDDLAKARALELLQLVGMPDPEQRLSSYQHQLSGGQRQRVMIAIALALQPKLVIADEPTTALDVTVQAQILDLLRMLQSETGAAILFVTHDLGVVAEMADRVVVMYAGQVVEQGTVRDVINYPEHPYTRALLNSMPGKVAALGERLEAIEGTVPSLFDMPTGCRFAPRCSHAWDKCHEDAPPLIEVTDVRSSRCWLADPEVAGNRRLNGDKPTPEETISVNLKETNGNGDRADEGEVLVQVRDLTKHFPIKSGILQRTVGHVRAVDGITFDLKRGSTVSLVGESGCGKTTTGRLVLRLLEPTDGSVQFEGRDLADIPKAELRGLRQRLQIIFQDPFSSLDPRMSTASIIGEGLAVHGIASGEERIERVAELLEMVGLSRRDLKKFPHQFSGGQRQRIGIARALATNPDVIVCDEAVSALDVSIQAQVLNLLKDLQAELGLTYLFITHDLNVVRYISDEVIVMYLGQMVERADTEELFSNPLHPYTRALLSAVPVVDPDLAWQRDRVVLEGDVPSPSNPPSGCRFHTRCQFATEECSTLTPEWVELAPEHEAAACACYVKEGSVFR